MSSADMGDIVKLTLRPFVDLIKAGAANVMCSYNRLNQTYACGNSKVLNGLLKTELGFQVRPIDHIIHRTHTG